MIASSEQRLLLNLIRRSLYVNSYIQSKIKVWIELWIVAGKCEMIGCGTKTGTAIKLKLMTFANVDWKVREEYCDKWHSKHKQHFF